MRYRRPDDEAPEVNTQIHWSTSPRGFKARFEEIVQEMKVVAQNQQQDDLFGKLCDVEQAFQADVSVLFLVSTGSSQRCTGRQQGHISEVPDLY